MMNRLKFSVCLSALIGFSAGSPRGSDAAEPSPELDIARRLNQAFIEVADKASPAVVVIRVKQKVAQPDSDEEGNGFDDNKCVEEPNQAKPPKKISLLTLGHPFGWITLQ